MAWEEDKKHIFGRFDCFVIATLRKTEDDTTEDFIDKMKILKNEIELFIKHLENQ